MHDFIFDVNHAREWQDLDIALRVVHELGADVGGDQQPDERRAVADHRRI